MRTLLTALLLVACSSPQEPIAAGEVAAQPPRDAAGPPTAASGPTFSAPVAGLAIGLELPARARAGDAVTARLHLANRGTTPLRVYFLEPEVFRSFQSSLLVRDAAGKVVGAPEVSPPHGYLPRESDFPLIAPGEDKVFSQRVALDDPALAAGGRFTVEWTYDNAVTQWKGGAQTLDGPTQPLFGGDPIPYIWTGEVTTAATLDLTAR